MMRLDSLFVIFLFIGAFLVKSEYRADVNVAGDVVTSKYRQNILQTHKWPEVWPYNEIDLARQDEQQDSLFYKDPRYVYHIDSSAVAALTEYYSEVFQFGDTVLDICSSWVSHFPREIALNEACGVGLNANELAANSQLNSFVVRDLNEHPQLPYPDSKFDIVTCVVSIDYLIHPLEIMAEIHRVLKPGGLAVISQSNRYYPTKAVNVWHSTGDLGHLQLIGAYFHFAQGFEQLQAFDISPYPGKTDPMFIVQARKSRIDTDRY